MNSTISDLYGVREYPGPMFGVEVECEFEQGSGTVDSPNRHWSLTVDNSLRNYGIEFISTPQDLKHICQQVSNLYKYIEDIDAVPIVTNRASTHVHLNVSDLTPEEVVKIILLYFILEYWFEEYAGEGRKGNLFSLGGQYSQTIFDILLERGELKYLFNTNGTKYSALNINTVNRLGTLEFRALKNLYNPEYTINWLTALYHLRNCALSFKSPRDIVELTDLSDTDFRNRVKKILDPLVGRGEVNIHHTNNNLSYCYYLAEHIETLKTKKVIKRYQNSTEQENDDIRYEPPDFVEETTQQTPRPIRRTTLQPTYVLDTEDFRTYTNRTAAHQNEEQNRRNRIRMLNTVLNRR